MSEPRVKNKVEQKAIAGMNVTRCRFCGGKPGDGKGTAFVPVTLRELAFIQANSHISRTVECLGLNPFKVKHRLAVTLTR